MTPSLGPQPPTFSGSPIASSASTARGINWAIGAEDPATRAASRNVARCPASTATDEISTPGKLRRVSSPARASASAARAARRHRDAPG
ncbi:MAG: hypothetical protein QOI83_4196, partial [Streptomycetaceae bacterium]|nr:hypothetical protein [Streptomycetaceae bacterium]